MSSLTTITGDTIFRYYRCVKIIGHGTDGCASLYERVSNGDELVVKESKSIRSNDDLKQEIRMLRKVLASGGCPNVVRILGDEYGFPRPDAQSLFLEYCALGDLHHQKALALVKGAVPEEYIWNAFIQLSKALNYLHNGPQGARGWLPIAHCDIKPANVLVCPGPTDTTPILKLADFSRAQELGLRTTTTARGTWDYMPPEKPSFTTRSDVWAVGGIVHWLALNTPPIDHFQYAAVLRNAAHGNRGRAYDTIRCRSYQINLSQENWGRKYAIERLKSPIYAPVWSKQYSNELDLWMSRALQLDPQNRITAQELMLMIPLGTQMMKQPVLLAPIETPPTPARKTMYLRNVSIGRLDDEHKEAHKAAIARRIAEGNQRAQARQAEAARQAIQAEARAAAEAAEEEVLPSVSVEPWSLFGYNKIVPTQSCTPPPRGNPCLMEKAQVASSNPFNQKAPSNQDTRNPFYQEPAASLRNPVHLRAAAPPAKPVFRNVAAMAPAQMDAGGDVVMEDAAGFDEEL